MKRALMLLAALGGLIALAGCAPSECSQAGGREYVDHYMPIMHLMPTASGGSIMTQTIVPIYACDMSGAEK